MTRLLLLGKNGQVARCIQDLKSQTAIEIIAVGRDVCDITMPNQIASTIAKTKPNIVVNAAAYTAVDRAEEERDKAFAVSRDGAANVARATADAGLPLIHISTDYVYSGEQVEAYVETDPTGPTGVYGASKLAGDIAVGECNPHALILRTSWVFSRHGANFAKTMLRLAADRDEVGVVADQFGNPTSAHEIARAILVASKEILNPGSEQYSGIYHFCGPQKMHWADFARLIFETSKSQGGPFSKVANITTAEYPTAAKRPKNSSMASTKFSRDFGYQHANLSDALKEVIQ